MNKILIVEDDADIAALEKDYLEMEGFRVKILADGEKVLAEIRAENYALILLDVMLPHGNGYELCKEIREFSNVPIILVTARSESMDIIRGLGLGSNDYITKPFDPAILVARVKACIASFDRQKSPEGEIMVNDLKIRPQSFQVFKNGKEVTMTPKEFELLCFLAKNPNRVFSREDLFEHIWGLDSLAETITVAVHINRIREKIEDDPENPKIIRTIWGTGYCLRNE